MMDESKLRIKLCKAGTGVSLIHKIHDEECYELTIELAEEEMARLLECIKLDVESTLEFGQGLLPAPEEFKGFKKGELFNLHKPAPLYPVNVTPLYHDYIKTLRSNIGSGVDYERIAKELQKVARQKSFVDMYSSTGKDYVETPSGGRRYLRRKSTLDNNNTLR